MIVITKNLFLGLIQRLGCSSRQDILTEAKTLLAFGGHAKIIPVQLGCIGLPWKSIQLSKYFTQRIFCKKYIKNIFVKNVPLSKQFQQVF